MANFSNDQYYEETSQYPDLTNSGAEPVPEHPQTSEQIYPPYSTFTFPEVPYGSGYGYPHMYPSGIPESNMVPPGTTTVQQSVGAFQPIGLHPQSGSQNGWDSQTTAFDFLSDKSVASQYVQSRVGNHQDVGGTPQQSPGSDGNRFVAIAPKPTTSPDMVGKGDMCEKSWPRLRQWYRKEGIKVGQPDDLKFRQNMRVVIASGEIGCVDPEYPDNTKIHYKICGGEMKFGKKCGAVLVALSDSPQVEDWLNEAPCSKCTKRTSIGVIRAIEKERKRARHSREGSED